MITTQQRCLAASVLIHGSLLSLLLFTPAFTREKPPLPVLTMVPTDIRLTDGDKIGGGNPDVQPPVTPPKAQEKPAQPAPAEPKHTETKAAEPTPVEPEPKPKPVKVASKVSKPVAVAADPIRPKPANPSQDTDPVVHTKPVKKPVKTAADIKVADTAKTRNPKDDKAEREAAEAAAEQEAAAQRRRDRANQLARLNAERAQLAKSLGGVAQAVGKQTSASTAIELPGPGGQAYAPYGSYLGTFYKQYWRKPSALSVRSASIVVEVVIARDGRLLDSKFEKSGIRELDDSVTELIRRYPQLRPLPEGTTDAQRTFRIKFTLEADSNT